MLTSAMGYLAAADATAMAAQTQAQCQGDGLVDEPATSRVHRYGALSLARSRRITAKHQ
jgi:hypothetical protein